MANEFNPIKSVDGVAVKCPSTFVYKLEDISAQDAGRTEDVVMNKKRIGQVTGLELKWENVTIADCAVILTQFNPEYITVEYLDAKAGGYLTAEFYVGNRSAPLYNCLKGVWEGVSFNIIKRNGVI